MNEWTQGRTAPKRKQPNLEPSDATQPQRKSNAGTSASAKFWASVSTDAPQSGQNWRSLYGRPGGATRLESADATRAKSAERGRIRAAWAARANRGRAAAVPGRARSIPTNCAAPRPLRSQAAGEAPTAANRRLFMVTERRTYPKPPPRRHSRNPSPSHQSDRQPSPPLYATGCPHVVKLHVTHDPSLLYTMPGGLATPTRPERGRLGHLQSPGQRQTSDLARGATRAGSTAFSQLPAGPVACSSPGAVATAAHQSPPGASPTPCGVVGGDVGPLPGRGLVRAAPLLLPQAPADETPDSVCCLNGDHSPVTDFPWHWQRPRSDPSGLTADCCDT